MNAFLFLAKHFQLLNRELTMVIFLWLVSIPSFSQELEVIGHSGARGLVPENTIPSFLRALHEGVTGLHMGVAISGDGNVVVSREPWVSSRICVDSLGKNIPISEDKKLNIYTMSLKEIQSYDCGSKYLPELPNQEKISLSKPLLQELIATCERLIKSDRLYQANYFIEINSAPTNDYIYHPPPKEYIKTVVDLVDQYLPRERVKIMSSDFRILQILDQDYPDIESGLVFESSLSVQQIVDSLGFVPKNMHPFQDFVNAEMIKQAHAITSEVIPFTINLTKDLIHLFDLGVDGIITDYPDSARHLAVTPSR